MSGIPPRRRGESNPAKTAERCVLHNGGDDVIFRGSRRWQEFGAITAQFVELRGYIDNAYERTTGRMDVQFDALRADLRITKEQK